MWCSRCKKEVMLNGMMADGNGGLMCYWHPLKEMARRHDAIHEAVVRWQSFILARLRPTTHNRPSSPRACSWQTLFPSHPFRTRFRLARSHYRRTGIHGARAAAQGSVRKSSQVANSPSMNAGNSASPALHPAWLLQATGKTRHPRNGATTGPIPTDGPSRRNGGGRPDVLAPASDSR